MVDTYLSIIDLLGTITQCVADLPEECLVSLSDCFSLSDCCKELPFIINGNFFGDGKLSEALVLIHKSNESAIIVVRRYGEDNFIELLKPTSNSPYNIKLSPVPIGEYNSYWEKWNLKLENHGIRISFLESSEVIMYWDKDTTSFKEYWTED